jgi:putative spermidine/putrescine transport system ATP-binding protein
MTTLRLDGIRKRFGQLEVLKGIDLDVASGEFVSLLGPSGCGKTTALRIVAGFERPDEGQLLIDGRDVVDVPANHRNMGMVFQSYSLFPNMTAQENVEFGLRIRRRSAKERAERARAMLETVGLADAAGRYPHQLSGGMQQRVALARALAIEPSVLLLDEPLSALDAKVRVTLREEIRRVQQEFGITTLYVTHDQEEALSISDRVAVLSRGQIEQIGDPMSIYQDPRTPFVAEFVGAMNRITGSLVAPGHGVIETRGMRFATGVPVSAPVGASMLMLVRPEAVRLAPLGSEGGSASADVEGEVATQTFLGSVTRLAVSTPLGALMADIPSVTSGDLRPGTKVAIRLDREAIKLMRLDGVGEQAAAEANGQVAVAATSER